jgi:hypothetical protein
MGFLLNKPKDDVGGTLPAVVIGMFVAFGGILVRRFLNETTTSSTDSR